MTEVISNQVFDATSARATERRIYTPWVLLVIVAAAAAQISVFQLGLYHVSADESARI